MLAMKDSGVAAVAEKLRGRIFSPETVEVPLEKFRVAAARQDHVRPHPVTGHPKP